MKKIIGIIFSLILAIPVTMAGFVDLSANHPYFEAIEFIQSRNIVSGYPDGSFQADRRIDRYELLKIVVESAYSDEAINTALDEYKALNYYYVDLKDVPMGEWFSPYVRVGIRDGIIQGYPNGEFGGQKMVNFVEALQIIMKTYGVPYDADSPIWYEDMVKKASSANLIPLDITAFNQEITRGQMAEMITRMIKYKEGDLEDYLGESFGIKQAYEDIELGNNQLEKIDEILKEQEDEQKQLTQCSDGVNNDGDDFIDKDDPGCWSNPGDPDSYNPNDNNEGNEPRCADKKDNDNDGLVDDKDPGCHTDGDANNANSYSAIDNDETDPIEEKPACSDGEDSDNDGLTDDKDPGCWKDVADENSYDPEDNNEGDEPACIDGKDNDNDGFIDDKDPGCHTDNDLNNPDSYDPADNDETHVWVDPEPFFNDKNEENAQLLVDALEAYKADQGFYPGNLPDMPECLVNVGGSGLALAPYIEGGVVPNTPKPNQDLQVADTFCQQTYFYIALGFGGEFRKGYALIAPMTDPNRANFLLSDIDLFPENPTAEQLKEVLENYDTTKIIDADVNDRILFLTN